MKNYYFTFGKLKTHPFYRRLDHSKARNLRSAIEIFKMYFPNRENPMLCNCSIVYTEKDFKDTQMYISGNFGKRCHGIIGFKALKNKDSDKNEEHT